MRPDTHGRRGVGLEAGFYPRPYRPCTNMRLGVDLPKRPARPTERSTGRSRQERGYGRPGVVVCEDGGLRNGNTGLIRKGSPGGDTMGCLGSRRVRKGDQIGDEEPLGGTCSL